MRTFVAALAASAVLTAAPGFAAVDAVPERAREAVRLGQHEKSESDGSQGAMHRHPMHEHRPDGNHHHRVIIVYVPVGSTYAPYYFPSSSGYVDADPPVDAYRDLSGFYYWCPDPAGYYPYTVDCAIAWRLVAP